MASIYQSASKAAKEYEIWRQPGGRGEHRRISEGRAL